MIHFFEKFKIPTLFGLGIILAGIIGGVYLIVTEQNFISEASPNLSPKNITVSNIDATSATISWITSEKTYSVVSLSQSTFLKSSHTDERDINIPSTYNSHSVRLKNLLPKTTYHFTINSGRIKSTPLSFQTAVPQTSQNNFGPVIGSIVSLDKPLEEGIAYLSIPQAITQSAVIKNSGNFLIPLNLTYKADLSDIFSLSGETIAKLEVVSKEGQVEVNFKLLAEGTNLPVIKLGQNLDLTVPPLEATPQLETQPSAEITPSFEDLETFDLNGDGVINATDNAIVLKNFGKSPQNKKADLNSDGVVDQKDLDLMSEKINQFNNP